MAKKNDSLPTEKQIKDWVRQTISFYSGYRVSKLKDTQELLKPPIEIDPASLVDLAGTLRHGVKNYNPDDTVLVSDVDDETVGGITTMVKEKILGA